MSRGKNMTCLFSDAGRAELRSFVDRATLFAFDLDGTLAPIVPDPASIVITPEIKSCLIDLNKVAPVAVITGRASADAREHLGFIPRFLVGNHGAEGLPGRGKREGEYVRLCRDWKEQLEMLLPDRNSAGIVIEDKGATLTLHYRNAPDRERAHIEILSAFARLLPPPRPVSGKFVENIVPQDAPNKGEALQLIMRYLGCFRALFVGDDVTDEDVFSLKDDRILGIRVGKSTRSAARQFICEQVEIEALFKEVMGILKK